MITSLLTLASERVLIFTQGQGHHRPPQDGAGQQDLQRLPSGHRGPNAPVRISTLSEASVSSDVITGFYTNRHFRLDRRETQDGRGGARGPSEGKEDKRWGCDI